MVSFTQSIFNAKIEKYLELQRSDAYLELYRRIYQGEHSTEVSTDVQAKYHLSDAVMESFFNRLPIEG